MRRPIAAAAGGMLLVSACVYYNALYNGERLLHEADELRLAGSDSLAAARYRDVVRKAAKGFRQEPEGEWADEALLLMGRAYLRLGELREGRAALEEAERRAGSDEVRLSAEMNLGVAMVVAGNTDGGTLLLSRAIRGLPPGLMRAEGHLWRARALLSSSPDQTDLGWWDLDQAAAERSVRMDAALERVFFGIRLGVRERAQEGMDRLLAYGEAGARADTVVALARAAEGAWGPAVAAGLISGADTARWSPTPRGRILLTRARFVREAGDSIRAEELVQRVADGLGPAAADARLDLAAWQLARAHDLLDARSVLPILLPAVRSEEVARRVEDLQAMIDLSERGLSDPLAWFAAGELARDGLGAPHLARGLFLAYADAVPSDPWTAKALLAALDLSMDEGDRAWLRGRLEGRADSPYVLAASGEPALGLEALEEELARRLDSMRIR